MVWGLGVEMTEAFRANARGTARTPAPSHPHTARSPSPPRHANPPTSLAFSARSISISAPPPPGTTAGKTPFEGEGHQRLLLLPESQGQNLAHAVSVPLESALE